VALLWTALLSLLSSNVWLWELQETWSVQPPAAWINAGPVATKLPQILLLGDERPSLNWYVGRELVSGRQARRALHHDRGELLVLSQQDPSNAALRCQVIHSAVASNSAAPALFRCEQH